MGCSKDEEEKNVYSRWLENIKVYYPLDTYIFIYLCVYVYIYTRTEIA